MMRWLSVFISLFLLLWLAACTSSETEERLDETVETAQVPATASVIKPTLPPAADLTTPTEEPSLTAAPDPTRTPTQPATLNPTQTPSVTAVVTVPPTQIPRETRTGIAEVDYVVDTILSNDLDARMALVRFVTAGCTTADGLGTTPRCENNQAEGTLVDFFPLGGIGEGSSVPPSQLADVLDFEAKSLYAAYVVSEDLPDRVEFPRGTYSLFFSTAASGESNDTAVILRVDNDGYIVRLDSLVGIPLDFYFQQMAADLVATPPEIEMFATEAVEILVYPPESD